MWNTIVMLSALNVLFLLMHEFDACYRGEWKMFGVLKRFDEDRQYLIFLYLHIPILLLCFFYMWIVVNSMFITLWIAINLLSVVHLLIHLVALRWRSNVFKSVHSFLFITGAAVVSLLNLMLWARY